jgi:hypothetical protein
LATSEIELILDKGHLDVDYATLLNLVDEIEFDLDNMYTDVSDADLESYLSQEEMESLIDEYY